MCDILSSNFETEFPKVVDAMRRASFIAIDTEFTGLDNDSKDKHSLFDTTSERYNKLRQHANSFIINQIGISCFISDEKKDSIYHVCSFNFFICPRALGIRDTRFMLQASCIEFLCQHKFDFNKFAYEGLSYLNEPQESELRRQLKKKDPFDGIRVDMDYYIMQECCERVSNWLAAIPVHSPARASPPENPCQDDDNRLTLNVPLCVSEYVVHKKIRTDFEETWTFPGGNRQILVEKVSPKRRLELQEAGDDLHDKLIEQLLGFTRVFHELIRLKKPIVGHNLVVDLILMYNQFYKPLPKKLETFKHEIIDLFPKIFDTKHIAYEASKLPQLKESTLFSSSVLGDLYKAVSSRNGVFFVLCSPDIRHAQGFERYEHLELFHEAGYDAYLAGYVFLRMAHIFVTYKKPSRDHCSLPFDKLIACMVSFRNKVNLIRANAAYLNFEGREVVTNRPKWLVVEACGHTELSVSEITQMCSQYGSVDVKLIEPGRALVAVSNFRCARDIVKNFQRDKNIRITYYSLVQHDPTVRALLWCGAGISGLIGAALLITLTRRIAA